MVLIFEDSPEGQTHYCIGCESEARIGYTNVAHTCGRLPAPVELPDTKTVEWTTGRKNLLDLVEKYPTQIVNALDSAYVAGLDDGRADERERVVNEAELWFLRLHNEPEKWSVAQAIKSITNINKMENDEDFYNTLIHTHGLGDLKGPIHCAYKKPCPMHTKDGLLSKITIENLTKAAEMANEDQRETVMKSNGYKNKPVDVSTGVAEAMAKSIEIQVKNKPVKQYRAQDGAQAPTERSWPDMFRSEFGLHFKDSPGELLFAIEFIKEVESAAFERGKREALSANDTKE